MTNTQSFTSNSPETFAEATDVQIKIEKLDKRERQIFAEIQIPYSVEQVWQVITNYETFPEFMPSIGESRRLEQTANGFQLEQTRTKSLMGMNFSARSLFEVKEDSPHCVHYELLEGDMQAFSGYWRLEPCQLSNSETGTKLIYDFFVCPKKMLPMPLVEHVMSNDVPAALESIRQRVADVVG